MKLRFLILISLFFFSPLMGYNLPSISDASTDMNEEIRQLDAIIGATQESLEAQKKIRIQVEQYRKLQQQYLKNADNRELLFQIIKMAYTLRESINKNHLSHAFSKTFIEELTLFAQVANKRILPKAN